jgi:hypothetical protein
MPLHKADALLFFFAFAPRTAARIHARGEQTYPVRLFSVRWFRRDIGWWRGCRGTETERACASAGWKHGMELDV